MAIEVECPECGHTHQIPLEDIPNGKKKVSVDNMVDAIADASPKNLTASEIADATGVTQQAISARRDELEADERVEYGQVGNARAYWLSPKTRIR